MTVKEAVKIGRRRPATRPIAPPPRPEALPSTYEETVLDLVAVQARRVHATWDIAGSDLARARRVLGDSGRFVLRFHDLTFVLFDGTNANRIFDIPVGENDRSWYVEFWNAGGSWLADLVLIGAKGREIVLARSNAIQTHREGSGPAGPIDWLRVDGDPRRRTKVVPPGFPPRPGAEPPGHPDPDLTMSAVRREDVAEFYRSLFEGTGGR